MSKRKVYAHTDLQNSITTNSHDDDVLLKDSSMLCIIERVFIDS